MAENINGINNYYKYNNPELSKYDTDNDNQLSVFELENIQDENGLAILEEELLSSLQNNELTEEEKISALEDKLKSAKEELGLISSGINALKGFLGLGSNTKKCEKAIENYKSGKISYEEADKIISEFSSKHSGFVNLAANIATGVVAVLAVGSAVATGGLSLAAAAGIGAAAGALTKTGIKFADRATNKVKGDALDAKQIAKDAVTGAVDGAVSVATMGIGAGTVTAKTVATQGLKETIIKGAASGAKAGAISGAASGATDYTVEAALEKDVEFNTKDLLKQTAETALGGAIAGGAMGGIASGLQYHSVSNKINAQSNNVNTDIIDDTALTELTESAQTAEANKPVTFDTTPETAIPKNNPDDLNIAQKSASNASEKELPSEALENLNQKTKELSQTYNSKINEAKGQIEEEFGQMRSKVKITGRAKSENSIFSKLKNKYLNNNLDINSYEVCKNNIGDGFGTRIQIRSLDAAEAQEIIENGLKGYDISYNQFTDYINGNTASLDKATIETLDTLKEPIINTLKERQSQEVVDQLINSIQNHKITLTELNNYGDEFTSYFTPKQVQQIMDSFPDSQLTIVNKDFLENYNVTKYDENNRLIQTFKDGVIERYNPNTGEVIKTINTNTQKSVKNSGYPTSQMNITHTFQDNTTGFGELQIRGTQVNHLADSEHIIYDIYKGKITGDDLKYSDIVSVINKISKGSGFDEYNQFIADTYKHFRLEELGISSPIPQIQNYNIVDNLNQTLSQQELNLLDIDSLIEISKRK